MDILLSPTHYARECLKFTSSGVYATGSQSVLHGSQGIRGYISITFALKCTYHFKLKEQSFAKKIIAEIP